MIRIKSIILFFVFLILIFSVYAQDCYNETLAFCINMSFQCGFDFYREIAPTVDSSLCYDNYELCVKMRDICNWSEECAYCGNRIVEPFMGEECDDGNNDYSDSCINCHLAYCGDGYVWSGHEECDYNDPFADYYCECFYGPNSYCSKDCLCVVRPLDCCNESLSYCQSLSESCGWGIDFGRPANYVDNFSPSLCNNSYDFCLDIKEVCLPTGYCGDGIVQEELGEECENDSDCPDGYVCADNCTCVYQPGCGNGILDEGEECDPNYEWGDWICEYNYGYDER